MTTLCTNEIISTHTVPEIITAGIKVITMTTFRFSELFVFKFLYI